MKKDLNFEKGHKPKTEVRDWPAAGMPTVLNFPPQAYRHIRTDEVESFTKDLQRRFGLVSDIGGASGGTVSFCIRGGTGAAYRCDCDMDSSARLLANQGDLIRDWNSQPTVLHFQPDAYATVSPDELENWLTEIKDRLGLELTPDAAREPTTTFCTEGNSGYACDSDFEEFTAG